MNIHETQTSYGEFKRTVTMRIPVKQLYEAASGRKGEKTQVLAKRPAQDSLYAARELYLSEDSVIVITWVETLPEMAK